jgi:ornithine carbamoyltransferase
MNHLKIVQGAEQAVPPLSAAAGALPKRDLLSLQDLTSDEVDSVLKLALSVKAHPARYEHSLEGKTLAMLFEKPSLRTRMTFQVGMSQLGGLAVYLSPQEVGLGKRESVKDVARNLSRWVDGVVARVFCHATFGNWLKTPRSRSSTVFPTWSTHVRRLGII